MKNKISFDPDEELIAFADDFCKTFWNIDNTNLYSEKGSYHIMLSDVFENTKGNKYVIRVSNRTGIIQLRKKDIKAFSDDLVFFLILWLRCKFENKECSEEVIDLACLKKIKQLNPNHFEQTKKDLVSWLKSITVNPSLTKLRIEEVLTTNI